MKFLTDFKEFAIKGNMIDLAVAVIIGAAFGKVIDSLVKDIIMPPIGFLVGGVNFQHLYFSLGSDRFATLEAAEKAGAPIIKYGAFITTLVDFLIVALAIFVALKVLDRMSGGRLLTKAEAPAAVSG